MQQKPEIFGGHKLRQGWFNMNDPLEDQQRRAVMEMIQNADRIEIMSTSSLASIVFSVRVNDDNHCPFETIPNPSDPNAQPVIVHRILVKVGLISNNGREYVDLPRWKNQYQGDGNFQVTDRAEFRLEVATQRQVYRDTVASISQDGKVSLFEPACPNIFAHFQRDRDNRADDDFFQIFRDLLHSRRFIPRPNSDRRDPNTVGPHANDTDAVHQLLRLGQGNGVYLSAIVMELAEGAVTIHDRIAANRGGVGNRELINLWHFQLTRMFETGVMHTDAHAWNVLCTPGNPEKMQIIDFGRVTRSGNRGIIARHGENNVTRLDPAIYTRLRDAQHDRAAAVLQGIANLPGNRHDAGVLMFGILCAVRGGGGRNRSELAERVRDWYQTGGGRTPARGRDELVRLLEQGQRPAPEPRQRPAPEPVVIQMPAPEPIQRQPIGFRQLDVNGITELQQPNIPNAEEQRLRLEEERRRAAETERLRLAAEAERLRLEEERRRAAEAEAERLRLEEERRRAAEAEAERLRLEEERRRAAEAEAERLRLEEDRRRAAESKRDKDAKSQAKFDLEQKARVEMWYRTKAKEREAAAAREAENERKATEAARLEREARRAEASRLERQAQERVDRENNGRIVVDQRNRAERRQYVFNMMNSMSNGRGRPEDLPTEEWVGFFNNFSYYDGPLGPGYYRAPGRVFINDDDRQIRRRYTHQMRVIDGEYVDYGEYTRDPREVEGRRLHMDEYDRARLLFYMTEQDTPLAFIPYDNNLSELDVAYEFRANGDRGSGYYRINPEGAEFVTFELLSRGRFGPGLYIKPPPPPPSDGLVVYLAKSLVNLFSFGGIGKLNGGALVKSKRSPASKLKITENTDISEVGLILKDALNKDDKHSAILIMAQSLGVDTTINTKFKISDEVLLYMAHTIMFAFSPIKYDTYKMPLITENRMDNSKINILTIKDSPKSSRKNKSPKRSVTAKKSYKPIITQN
jgi:hypothetical protein